MPWLPQGTSLRVLLVRPRPSEPPPKASSKGLIMCITAWTTVGTLRKQTYRHFPLPRTWDFYWYLEFRVIRGCSAWNWAVRVILGLKTQSPLLTPKTESASAYLSPVINSVFSSPKDEDTFKHSQNARRQRASYYVGYLHVTIPASHFCLLLRYYVIIYSNLKDDIV